MPSPDPGSRPAGSRCEQPATRRETIPPAPASPRSIETIPPTGQDSVPEAPRQNALISKDFGRYQILRCLGQGAMGAVYQARDTQLDRLVALKIPKFSGQAEPGLLERFYREARSAATLSHPNICPVFDVGEHAGTHYISMGFIEGRPLSAFIKPGRPLPEQKAASVIRKLALALLEAHQRGIVHRDLKPDNVMVDQRGQPVIMDFGLAQKAEAEGDIRSTQAGQMMGTPAYMSPEQVDGDVEKIGPASDVYSLGVIFYELLTGELPYQGSLASVLAQIIKGEPAPPSEKTKGLDTGLESICLKMMAADLNQRYQTMREVAEALTAWIKGESTLSTKGAEAGGGSHQESDDELAALFSVVNADAKPIHETLHPETRRTARPKPAKQGSREVRNEPWFLRPWALWSAGGLAALSLLLGVVLFLKVGDQQVKIEIDDPNAEVFVDGDRVTIKNRVATVELRPGEHNLEVRRGDVVVQTDKFEVLKGKNPVLKISVVEPAEEWPMLAANDPPSEIPLKVVEPAPKPAPSEPVRVSTASQPAQPARPEPVAVRPLGPPNGQAAPPAKVDGDIDRAFAEMFVQERRGSLGAKFVHNGQYISIHQAQQIPDDDFTIYSVSIRSGQRLPKDYVEKMARLPALAAFSTTSDIADDEVLRLLCQSKSLVHLTLRSQLISDAGLKHVAGLKTLSYLDLRGARITDRGLAALKALKSLKTLGLSRTRITDESAEIISQFRDLETLYLDETSITDKTIEKIVSLPKLRMLLLSNTQVTDAGVKQLAALERLVILHLSQTKVTDTGLSYLTVVPYLEGLQLAGCPITDAGITEHVAKYPRLHSLDISDTPISDAGLAALAKDRRMSSLQFRNTRVTQAGLDRFRELQPKCYLYPKSVSGTTSN